MSERDEPVGPAAASGPGNPPPGGAPPGAASGEGAPSAEAAPLSQEPRRAGSIPAPATVPRPSARPPAANPAASKPPPAEARARKGTLDGLAHPSAPPAPAPLVEAHAPLQAEAYRAIRDEDDFDAEKTMVVESDPDEAPTADYDPRQMGAYDPRARGVYGAAMAAPVIPPAPLPPTFDDPAPPTIQNPPREAPPPVAMIPEARPSEGRRRTSRRTVRIPDDPVKRRSELPPADDEHRPTTRSGAPIADLDFGDEITIVRPLRIISVGEDAASAVSSPLATWPPSQRNAELLRAGTPMVAEPMVAEPMVAEPVAAPAWGPAEQGTPPPPTAQSAGPSESPQIDVETADVSIPPEPGDREELIEEIELESHHDIDVPAPEPAKQRPPPPPNKRREEAAQHRARDPLPTSPHDLRKGKPWWEELFADEYIRTMDRLDPAVAKREVDFIEESLGLEQHAVVLDLACGMGEVTTELAGRGYNVVGMDLSTGMLARAQANAKARLRADPNYKPPSFVQTDMRELALEEEFDGIYCWSTSFGLFDDEKNLDMLHRLHRALRQGGLLLLDVANRDYVAPRTPSLVWFEGEACICMDDVFVDFFSSRLRVKRTAMFEGGSSRELEYSIRLYTLHELGKMLHEAGFKVLEVTGHPAYPGTFFGTESPRIIVLAERS